MNTRSRSRRSVALATIAAAGLAVPLLAAGPASAAESSITDAVFTWSLNNESGGGAYDGSCNFLVAGAAGNSGSSRSWTAADVGTLYKTSDANVEILKPDANGNPVAPNWDTKCDAPNGTKVTAWGAGANLYTGNYVRISGGTGTTDAAGTTTVSWTGSFTVAYYAGLTYWSASDPVLTVDAAGNGKLTATGTGFGASMEDPTKWGAIAPTQITLATFANGELTADGFQATPAYRGVEVTLGSGAQSRTGADWGAFPQDFVDFQMVTGQASYWYSSGAARDGAKVANPVRVSFTSTEEQPETPSQPEDITVDVPTVTEPEVPESGTFGWAFSSQNPVSLGTAAQSGANFTAAGKLNDIVVTDTRAGGGKTYEWSIAGQVGDFAAKGKSFSGGFLGWAPKVVSGDVQAGSTVESTHAGGLGLGQSRTLASSAKAASAVVGADLALVIPGSTPAGNYTATLTVTALQ